MRSAIVAIALFFGGAVAHAGEVGIRFNNFVTTDGLFNLSLNSAGKLFQGKYTVEPFGGRFANNLFIETAFGRYFTADFDSPSFWVAEASPGVRVDAGPMRFKLSQGGAFFNSTSGRFQFATHFGISFVDQRSGVSVGLERSHYSSGDSGAGAGYDLTGFVIGIAL